MTAIPEIVTGYVVDLAISLKKNGLPFVIPQTASVAVALVSMDHTQRLTAAAVSQVSTAPGANWATSLVVIELLPDATEAITYQGLALLEIQVNDAGRPKPWFVPVRIITGNIP